MLNLNMRSRILAPRYTSEPWTQRRQTLEKRRSGEPAAKRSVGSGMNSSIVRGGLVAQRSVPLCSLAPEGTRLLRICCARATIPAWSGAEEAADLGWSRGDLNP